MGKYYAQTNKYGELVKHIAVLENAGENVEIELNIMRYGGHKEDQLDIRRWTDKGVMLKGIALKESSARKLMECLMDYFEEV